MSRRRVARLEQLERDARSQGIVRCADCPPIRTVTWKHGEPEPKGSDACESCGGPYNYSDVAMVTQIVVIEPG